MFPPVDTKNAFAVGAFLEGQFRKLYPDCQPGLMNDVFRDVTRLYRGDNRDYAAIDLLYHDLEHTLQAAVCVALILAGRRAAGIQPGVSQRHFELAIAAALLHDTGYLKLRSDQGGTGAKYTYCHVLRSCAFAASYLPTVGVNEFELEAVLDAINCTGSAKQVSRLMFRDEVERFIGHAVATGDYLAQMSAPDYPDELEILFDEFEESDEFLRTPPERRTFRSRADLVRRTPDFWTKVVQPKLERELDGVYRFLAVPYPDGINEYLVAVDRNLAAIRARAISGGG